jgi:hypothetical protein
VLHHNLANLTFKAMWEKKSNLLCSMLATGQSKETTLFVQQFIISFLENSCGLHFIYPFWSYAAEISASWLYWPSRNSDYESRCLHRRASWLKKKKFRDEALLWHERVLQIIVNKI